MRIGGRRLGTIARAVFQRRHYLAMCRAFTVYADPPDALGRYLLGRGGYPHRISVRTPIGPYALTLYNHDDILTVNEIFCRQDYPAGPSDRVVVDFGSNIGISAAYFLTRSAEAHAHLFEPLALNLERLRPNLAPLEGRYTLHPVAVGLSDGEATFGWEETGRYGGIGRETGRTVQVPCVDANAALAEIVETHGRIDILKIDIETLEREITARIPPRLAARIRRIYVENRFAENPLPATHALVQYGPIAQFTARDSASI